MLLAMELIQHNIAKIKYLYFEFDIENKKNEYWGNPVF